MDLLRTTVFFPGYLDPISSKLTLTKRRKREKERARRKKGGEEKKAMAAPLIFIMATLDAKGPFGGDVFKNPARYMYEKLKLKNWV